jgi:hypothetical protein
VMPTCISHWHWQRRTDGPMRIVTIVYMTSNYCIFSNSPLLYFPNDLIIVFFICCICIVVYIVLYFV